jgi:hypothetical protein
MNKGVNDYQGVDGILIICVYIYIYIFFFNGLPVSYKLQFNDRLQCLKPLV